jgi:hypothetical protein
MPEPYVDRPNASQFDRMDGFINDKVTLNSEPGLRGGVVAVLTGDAKGRARFSPWRPLLPTTAPKARRCYRR